MTLIPYQAGGTEFDAYIAYPAASTPRPAVLVCHAYGGRDAFAESKANALAKLGYVGAAIDLYGIGKRGTDASSSSALMTELMRNPPILRERLRAAFEAIRELPRVDKVRMGAIGFCFGGMCALLLARMGLPLRGVASFHGLLKTGEPLNQRIAARVLVLHGLDDPMAPPADIGAFAQAMKDGAADWQLHAYPGVMHAFTNPAANAPAEGKAYNAEADARSWRTMTNFWTEVFG